MIAVQIAQSWQTIAAWNINPNDPAVLSITQIHSGSATNVIPDEATLVGAVSTFSVEVLNLSEQRRCEIAHRTVAAFGAEVDFRFHRNYPPLTVSAFEE